MSALLVLLLACLYQGSVDASEIVCSNNCPIVHPQQHFCNADSAYKVQVLSSEFINDNHEPVVHAYSRYARYQATVIQSFKGWASVGSDITFYSPSFACSISTLFDEGIYLIAGKVSDGMLIITHCDGLAAGWDDLTPTQRAGVEGNYQENCNSCQIKSAGTTRWFGGEAAIAGEESGYWGVEGCFYNPIPSYRYGGKDCETLYTYCVPSTVETGVCTWGDTTEYSGCFQEREDTWFFEEKGRPAFTCRSQCAGQTNKQLRYQCIKETKKLMNLGIPRC